MVFSCFYVLNVFIYVFSAFVCGCLREKSARLECFSLGLLIQELLWRLRHAHCLALLANRYIAGQLKTPKGTRGGIRCDLRAGSGATSHHASNVSLFYFISTYSIHLFESMFIQGFKKKILYDVI